MTKVIFHIENRGPFFLYHWLFLMISGLRFIVNKSPSSGNIISERLEQNVDKFNNIFTKPYYIYFSYIENFNNYQIETFDIIKNDFVVIKKEDISENDIIINNYGELLSPYTNLYNKIENLTFLQNLFLSNIDKKLLDKKFNFDYIYIRRDKAHLCDGNKQDNYSKRRHILNEIDFCNELQKHNYSCIYLEDYCLIDKINIFKNAKKIISPNSAGLSFIIFCNTNCSIIEINTKNPHQVDNQYDNICNILHIPYKRYTNVQKIDYADNMIIDINDFNNFLNVAF
jgi:hypothetical protein